MNLAQVHSKQWCNIKNLWVICSILSKFEHLPNLKPVKLVCGSYILSYTVKIPGPCFTPCFTKTTYWLLTIQHYQLNKQQEAATTWHLAALVGKPTQTRHATSITCVCQSKCTWMSTQQEQNTFLTRLKYRCILHNGENISVMNSVLHNWKKNELLNVLVHSKQPQ
jgi:hypothetical protein